MNTPIINIWVSCVSREIFNKTTDVAVGSYIFQNPIHTFNASPTLIDDSKILCTSEFVKRMVKHDFHKTASIEFEKIKSDYVLLDFADCRYGYASFLHNKGSRVCLSPSINMTLQSSFCPTDYIKVDSLQIYKHTWEIYVNDFLAYITSIYPEDRIILNQVKFAEFSKQGEGVKRFNTADRDRRWESQIVKIEKMVLDKLPNLRVIDNQDISIIGNPKHRLGLSSLHFIDEVYAKKAEKLLGLVKI